MIRYIVVMLFFLPAPIFLKSQTPGSISHREYHLQNDSLVWQVAIEFCNLFNKPDRVAMDEFLPNDFIMQWMHENFIGKKGLLNAMTDTAVHSTMEYIIDRNEKAIIRYSDDFSAASLNTSFEFINQSIRQRIEKENGYGLCIFYLQKITGRWRIKTIHLDLHCSLCKF